MTTATQLTAYHGSPELKAEVLAQLTRHRQLDQIVRGSGYWDGPIDANNNRNWIPGNGYWSSGRGCAVGCLTHDPKGGHKQYPTRWGIPIELAWLEDGIFERLPVDDAPHWPIRFMGAIRPGADLSLVWPRTALTVMEDPNYGMLRLVDGFPTIAAGILQVADFWRHNIAETHGDESTADSEELENATDGVTGWAASAAGAYSPLEAASDAARAAAYSVYPATIMYQLCSAMLSEARDMDQSRPLLAPMYIRDVIAEEKYCHWLANTLINLVESAPMVAAT